MNKMSLDFQEGLCKYEDITDELRDVAYHACLTKVIYAVDGRNAWYNTWVKRYYPSTYSLSLEDTKRMVEKKRVQGSTWSIKEVPAIAFIGHNYALLVTQINTNDILKKYPFTDAIQPSIDKIADCFEPEDYNDDIIRLISKQPDQIQKAKQFATYKSYSIGRDYYLRWESSQNKDIKYSMAEKWRKEYLSLLKTKCYFGCSLEQYDDSALIMELPSISPVAQAGIKVGDEVLWVKSDADDIKCNNILDFISKIQPHENITFKVERNGKKHYIKLRTTSFYEVFGGNSKQKPMKVK